MIDLIQAATTNQSNQVRKQAEKTIIELREQKPEEFFQQATKIFTSSQVAASIRQATGTLIAVSAVAKNQNGEFIWNTISEGTKNIVKNGNLAQLIDPLKNIRRTAANCVSAICFVQLPRKQWDGIVQKICVNASHENSIVKESSILTLGFICSRMKQKLDFCFDPNTQQKLLCAIILGLQQNEQALVQTSLIALRDSMSSLGKILQNEQYRMFILKQLADAVKNEQYRVDGLQILGEFVKTCYDYLETYMEGLTTLLLPIINDTANQQSCVAAIQIWENIAAEYKDLTDQKNGVKNYLTGRVGQNIVVALLRSLFIMNDGEDDESPISDSASKALQTIFENGSLQYQNIVVEFVKSSVSQPNWKLRQASVKAFSLLLYGLPDSESEKMISDSINQLFGLLSDASVQVQIATMESMVIITQVCGKFLLRHPHLTDYLTIILGKVNISQKFLKIACRIIENLCESEKQQKFGKFSDLSDVLIGIFLNKYLEPNASLSVVDWCTRTIMSVIQVTKNIETLKKYTNLVMNNLDNINHIQNVEIRQTINSSFFTVIQYCLYSMKNLQRVENDPQIQMLISQIYKKVTDSFVLRNTIFTDGLYVVDALVGFSNGNLLLLTDFWNYLTVALARYEDPQIFKATVSCIGSFLNNYSTAMGDRLDSFVPIMIQLIQQPKFSKQLKIDCLVLLGDVFLLCSDQASKYLQKFLSVIQICCTAAIQMTQTDFAYSEQLKQSVIQTLTCIVHGSGVNKTSDNLLKQNVANFFYFVMVSCQSKSRPTVNYLKKCVLFMADLAQMAPSQVQPLKSQAFIGQCIENLNKFNKNHEYDDTIRFARKMLK